MIIISEKYEVRNSNCTSFSRENLVDGLPLDRSTESLEYPHGGDPSATFRGILRRESKVIRQKSTFWGVSLEKVREDVLIFKSRKYEILVVG